MGGSLTKGGDPIPKQQISTGKLYDRFIKYFDVDEAYGELLRLAKKIGRPFEKKGKRGRPLGAEPEEYAAYFVFSWNEGHKLHDMERYCVKFLDRKLDHSTFGKIINRIPLFYFILLLEAFAHRIEQLLHTAVVAFADSTGVSTGIYKETMHKGRLTKIRKDFKLHVLAGYLPEHSLTYIKTGLASDKHTSDAEGAKQMLDRIVEWIAYFLADRGYDAEKVHEACTKKGMIDVVKRKGRKSKMATYRSLTDKFFNTNLYKEIRGVIETIFAGLENKGLLKTRLRNPSTIFKYALASAIFHNQRTSIFARLIKIVAIFRNTR
jgi:hypothetical protein